MLHLSAVLVARQHSEDIHLASRRSALPRKKACLPNTKCATEVRRRRGTVWYQVALDWVLFLCLPSRVVGLNKSWPPVGTSTQTPRDMLSLDDFESASQELLHCTRRSLSHVKMQAAPSHFVSEVRLCARCTLCIPHIQHSTQYFRCEAFLTFCISMLSYSVYAAISPDQSSRPHCSALGSQLQDNGSVAVGYSRRVLLMYK